MALETRGNYRYGDRQSDIHDELVSYSKLNGYVAQHFADVVCKCGGRIFLLLLDDTEGATVRKCKACSFEHPMGDSDEYLENAELEECACPCSSEDFEITIGVSLYDGSEDVRWLYIGCRCPKCGLTAVYGDWKNEFNGFQKLLARV